jgi:hypothetical protein
MRSFKKWLWRAGVAGALGIALPSTTVGDALVVKSSGTLGGTAYAEAGLPAAAVRLRDLDQDYSIP